MRRLTHTLLATVMIAVCGAMVSYVSVGLMGAAGGPGPGYNLDQCANGTLANLGVPCGTINSGNAAPKWQNGDLQGNNSAYREGDGIPYRAAITNLTTGTWTIRLEYAFAKGGIFAFDRLTRLNLTQAAAPCANTSVTCSGAPAFNFVIPGEVVSPSADSTVPALANHGRLHIAGDGRLQLTAIGGTDDQMSVWAGQGGVATFVSAGQNKTGNLATSFNDGLVTQIGLTTDSNSSSRQFALRVDVNCGLNASCDLMLGWTGHVASAIDWGAGKGAGSISGAPYHMGIVGVDQANGTSGGNQDRSVQLGDGGASVIDQTITLKKALDPSSDPGKFNLLIGGTSYVSNIGNGGSTGLVSLAAGSYTVSETAYDGNTNLADYTTSIYCADDAGHSFASTGATSLTVSLASGANLTCTITNARQQRPSISLVKTPSPPTYSNTGDIITYNFLVTNTGNVILSNVGVTDALLAGTVLCPKATLGVSESMTCTASYTITDANMLAQSVENTATASGTGPAGQSVQATSTATVTALQPPTPSLQLAKSASPSVFAQVGQVISYTYTVTNAGNVTLAGPITIADDKTTVACPSTGLFPGDSVTCTASYRITQSDLSSGSVTNLARATDRNSGTQSNQATATVASNNGTPALTLVKSASLLSYSSAGPVITYTYLITNSGGVSLAGPFSVSDDKLGTISPCGDAPLAPGASTSCTATYPVTQDDLDNNRTITNTATASGNGTTSNQSSATVNADQRPALTIVKAATPTTYSSVGQTISYSYAVTNTGNVTLAGPVTVTDDRAAVSCPTGSLAPGAATTCTASYTITQADLDGGSVTNTAKASANGTPSPTVSKTVTAEQRPALTIVKAATPTTYSSVNQTISYSYAVTNTGNVTLPGPVTVTDDKAAVSCPTGSLAPSAATTCTASYTITQADLDGGSVTNTAKASANGTPSPTVSKTVTAEQRPALTIAKSATPTTYSAVGAAISYSYAVTNTGNVTLAGPFTVADNKATASCPTTASLAPTAAITCTASYTITQADLDGGTVTNIAAASNGTTTSLPATKTVTADQRPALTIVKAATPTTYSAVGAAISYIYMVTNTGNVTLAGPVTVTDDKAAVSCPTGSLAPGAATTCTASYTITQADLDGGSVTNTAKASANGTTSPTASKTVTAEQRPALALAKSATPTTYDAVGTVITYTYGVTNAGNITLAGPFVVSDDKEGTINPCGTGPLAPGATTSCTATHAVTQADLDAGQITNVASVAGNGASSPPATVTDKAIQRPALTIVKSATPTTYTTVGQPISYSYVVTNTGNVTLTGPVTVADDKTATSCPTGSLAPGASTTCTASYTITQADLDGGSVTNTAKASANGTTSPPDSKTVTAVQSPALTIAKSATPTTYSAVGATIAYSYLVTNTGNVTLTGPVTVADDKTATSCPTGSLAPGAATTCTANYTITQADLDGGSVTNTAKASANGTTSPPDSKTVTAVQSPALTIAKSATPTTYSAVGATIAYSYLVTNTGNVTLPGPVTVADDKTATSCPTGSLAPGAATTCTANYTITQADLDGGSVTNTAKASANGTTSPPDSKTVTAVQSPALMIAKSATPTTYSSVGQTISYRYVVTNSGNVTLNGPFTVADNKATAFCPATASLAPAASIICTATYTTTQADLDAGSVTNIASASNQTTTSPTATATATAVQSRALSIAKSASPTSYSTVGTIISYNYVVKNTGNVTLAGPVSVSDNKATVTCPPGGLAPGASTTCTASYAITQVDLNSGSVTNTAKASANGTDSPTVNATVTATPPKLTVIKHVVNKYGGTATAGSFTMSVTGGNVSTPSFPGNELGTIITLNPGSFSVGESSLAGYTQTSAVGCSGTIGNGQSLTCTITNTDLQPKLTVIKHVVNNYSGTATAGSFTMSVTGTNVSRPSFAGAEGGTPITLNAGTFSVGESSLTGYTQTSAVGCSGTIAVGEVKTCTITNGSTATGALTIGFWQNKNGQTVIGTYSGTNCQTLRTWLNGFAPFADLTATNCTGVQTYVTNIIKAANASGTAMNAMLKAQMLATALDVYFSNPGLGGNRIGAATSIGSVKIDLTKVCNMVDSLGGATCSGATSDASSAFGGATSMTVSQLLAYAASQANAGGSAWYANVKAVQQLAKNTFDAINNQVAVIVP